MAGVAASIILTAALDAERSGYGNRTNITTDKKTPVAQFWDSSRILVILFFASILIGFLGGVINYFRDIKQTKDLRASERNLELNARENLDQNAPLRNTIRPNAAGPEPMDIEEAAQHVMREHRYRTPSAPVVIGRIPHADMESTGPWAWANLYEQQTEALDEDLDITEMMQTPTDLGGEPEDTDESTTTPPSSIHDDQEIPSQYEEEAMPPAYSEIDETAPVPRPRE